MFCKVTLVVLNTPLDLPVILTRFSRVTFSAAHEYLGLTSEVLRTEKAVNDIAVHHPPAPFYESGGLENLRQQFDQRCGRITLDLRSPNRQKRACEFQPATP